MALSIEKAGFVVTLILMLAAPGPISGKGIDVQKHPVEIDHHGIMRQSFKKSKAGKLKLIQTAEGYKTVKEKEMPEYKDQLVTVFENGKIIQEETFEAIRNRLAVCKKEEFCLK